MSGLAFRRVIKFGSRGTDVRAVKRGLSRAGHGTLLGSRNPVMGVGAVRHLSNFQRSIPVMPTGEYDKVTHRHLSQWFDDLARELWNEWEPVEVVDPAPDGSLQLPKDFRSTHETGGLPGFPAVDLFAQPDTVVLAPEDGTVDRLSGHDPREGGRPGGPYGWSIYIDAASGRYFMTHFATRKVKLGEQVKRGEAIGTVCDSKVSGKPGTSHIHLGKSRS